MPEIRSPSPPEVVAALQQRARARLAGLDEPAVHGLLADAVYQERRRLQKDEAPAAYEALLDAAARATHQGRAQAERALLDLVEVYALEIHNEFSPRTYQFATKILPHALTRLLTAAHPGQLLGADFDPASRIVVQGPLDKLRKLAQDHTLVVAPTHLSNLDSPLIGYALYAAGLPPCIYGAGLNLFEHPAMAFFMSRLGAYTVDRRKKLALYKDVLKDYSTFRIHQGAHSLFFPGGTRSRSGRLESHLKKGLLGTALTAWQEGLASGQPRPEPLIVPCTLSFALVLEAETLIEDSLAEEGRSRYIISDDEFSEPRTVASFARRVLNLDASTIIRFGEPLDPVGNPVDDAGRSIGPDGEPIERRDYVTDAAGAVIWDEQRDRVYTERMSAALCARYRRDNTALATHVAAFTAWNLLKQRTPRLDVYQRVLLRGLDRLLARADLLAAMDRVIAGIKRREEAGALRSALPGGAEESLAEALRRFGGYHKQPALQEAGPQIEVGPKLALYYGNRLLGYGLEAEVAG